MKGLPLITTLIVSMFFGCAQLKGEKGADGSTGATGATGTAGMTLTTSVFCFKNQVVNSVSLWFWYTTNIYSDGTKFIHCAVSSPSAEWGNSLFYKSTQTGSVTEYCSLTLDVDTGSSGFWTFSKSGSTKTVVYSDTGSASNNTTVTYASSDCTTN